MKMSKKKIIVGAVVAGTVGAVVAVTGTVAGADQGTGSGQQAAAQATPQYGLGAQLDKNPNAAHPQALAPRATPADVPDSFSLAQYDAGPGDQGQVGSCVSWAIDYSSYTILENEQGISGHPQAPMYTYAQIAQGNDQGSTPDETFDILTSQGVDTASDYTQGSYDYTDQPTQAERDNAANWKLSGYTPLNTGSGIDADVKQAVSSGEPVVITINVHKSWMNISAADAASYKYMPGDDSSDPIEGSHEVAIIGYDAQGVRIENSWNTTWGDGGYINVSWAYLEQEVLEANAVGKLVQ